MFRQESVHKPTHIAYAYSLLVDPKKPRAQNSSSDMRESYPKSVAQIMPFQNRNTLLASGRDPLTRCSSWSPAHRALGQPHKYVSSGALRILLQAHAGDRVSKSVPKGLGPT